MTIHKRKSKCGRRARIYLWYWPITVLLDFRVCRVSGDVALLIFVDVIDVSVVLDVSRVVVSLASCRSYSSERQKTDESHLISVAAQRPGNSLSSNFLHTFEEKQ